MPTTRSLITTFEVRSEDCFEELDLGTVRRFVIECDVARLPDGEAVIVQEHGDSLVHLVASQTQRQDLNQTPPTSPEEADPEVTR